MEVLKTRPGVVLTEIAGEKILVSAKSLQDSCPYVTQINESSAFIWHCLESGCSIDQLFENVEDEYELSKPEEAREAVLSFVRQLKDMNYLVKTEMECTDEQE